MSQIRYPVKPLISRRSRPARTRSRPGWPSEGPTEVSFKVFRQRARGSPSYRSESIAWWTARWRRHRFEFDQGKLFEQLGLTVVPGPRLWLRILAHLAKKLRSRRPGRRSETEPFVSANPNLTNCSGWPTTQSLAGATGLAAKVAPSDQTRALFALIMRLSTLSFLSSSTRRQRGDPAPPGSMKGRAPASQRLETAL